MNLQFKQLKIQQRMKSNKIISKKDERKNKLKNEVYYK